MKIYDQDELLDMKGKIQSESAKASAIKDLLGSKGWGLLSGYFEERYVTVADEHVHETPQDVSARNARLDEIKRIYSFLKMEFDSSALNLRALQEQLLLDDEHVPTPWEM
jgi:hypothetical protein